MPLPLTGDEDCLFVSFCIPNTPDWRRLIVAWVDTLSYGRAYDEKSGDIKQALAVGREIFESMCLMKCSEIFNNQRLLVAAIVGEEITVEEDGQPVTYDFTETGLGPRVDALAANFKTANWIAPDESIADILANSLYGNYVDPIPNPLTGDGLTDILDDQIEVLHNRLRMSDSSLFNPLGGEKNITEALETLLRRDIITDLEFLTPNIATIIERTFNTGDAGVVTTLKNLVKDIARDLDLPQEVADWLETQLETNERLSTAQILLLLSAAGGDTGAAGAIAAAIRDAQPVINLNNCCGNCEGDCTCNEQTVTLNGTGGAAGGTPTPAGGS